MWFGFVKDSINADTIPYCLEIIYYLISNNFQLILSIQWQFRSWFTIHLHYTIMVLQSYGSGTGWELAALLGLTRILWHVHMVWTWMVLTKANTLLQLKEVGSHSNHAPDALIPACALRSSPFEGLR